jgi:hypothetical protein
MNLDQLSLVGIPVMPGTNGHSAPSPAIQSTPVPTTAVDNAPIISWFAIAAVMVAIHFLWAKGAQVD